MTIWDEALSALMECGMDIGEAGRALKIDPLLSALQGRPVFDIETAARAIFRRFGLDWDSSDESLDHLLSARRPSALGAVRRALLP